MNQHGLSHYEVTMTSKFQSQVPCGIPIMVAGSWLRSPETQQGPAMQVSQALESRRSHLRQHQNFATRIHLRNTMVSGHEENKEMKRREDGDENKEILIDSMIQFSSFY